MPTLAEPLNKSLSSWPIQSIGNPPRFNGEDYPAHLVQPGQERVCFRCYCGDDECQIAYGMRSLMEPLAFFQMDRGRDPVPQ